MTGERVIISNKLQSSVVNELHVSHPGIVQMKIWHNIDKDCEVVVRSRSRCQGNAKNYQSDAGTLADCYACMANNSCGFRRTNGWTLLAGRGRCIQQLVGSDGANQHFCDRTVNKLKKIFARYGLPQTVVSDTGTQFLSESFKRMRNCAHNHSPLPSSIELTCRKVRRYAETRYRENQRERKTVRRYLEYYPASRHDHTKQQLTREDSGRIISRKKKPPSIMHSRTKDHFVEKRREDMQKQFNRRHGTVEKILLLVKPYIPGSGNRHKLSGKKALSNTASSHSEVDVKGRLLRSV
ncbi:hypothetical protein OSTOST_00028 [Ostertagia ostertagi]